MRLLALVLMSVTAGAAADPPRVECAGAARKPGAEVNPFLTRDAGCPGSGCDDSVALPWCGPFREVDGGVVALAHVTSADRRVVRILTWGSWLYFAGPEVLAPTTVPLVQHPVKVLIPARVGPFEAHSDGLSLADAGVLVPRPCLATPVQGLEETVVVGPDWRFFWSAPGEADWTYCGRIKPR